MNGSGKGGIFSFFTVWKQTYTSGMCLRGVNISFLKNYCLLLIPQLYYVVV